MKDKFSLDDPVWITSVHEASHLVFNRLIDKMNIGFPSPTYVELTPDDPRKSGGIDGGWVTEDNTENAPKQLDELTEKGLKCMVAQIAYLLAGYVSHRGIDDSISKLNLEYINPNHLSDISKCNKIAGRITGKPRFKVDNRYGMRINDANLKVLNLILILVEEIHELEAVKMAIDYSAKQLYQKKKLEGKELEEVIGEIDRLVLKKI